MEIVPKKEAYRGVSFKKMEIGDTFTCPSGNRDVFMKVFNPSLECPAALALSGPGVGRFVPGVEGKDGIVRNYTLNEV